MAERTIFHCDCNNYFASVELLKHPELRDCPVAVSGSEDNRHGIILAKNQVAKQYHVNTAETVWQAKRKCPSLVLLPPHTEEYKKYSKIINKIYSEYSDRVEPFGIDESWLDMTGSWQLFGASPSAVADGLRQRVREETGLTISVGISFNKVFAKLASDFRKPDATVLIQREDVQEVIWPMDVTALLYVGKRAKEILAELGIRTIGQLAVTDELLLRQVLGKAGCQLKAYAAGQDNSPVARIGEWEPVKSVGNGRTFKRDLHGYQDIRVAVGYLAEEVAARLREKKLYTSSVQIMIKDSQLKSITRQKRLDESTNLQKNIVKHAMDLVLNNWPMTKPIRMLTVTAMALSDTPSAAQLQFFSDNKNTNKKREQLEKSIDNIKNRYGKTSIMEAAVLHNDIGLEGKAKVVEKDKNDMD